MARKPNPGQEPKQPKNLEDSDIVSNSDSDYLVDSDSVSSMDINSDGGNQEVREVQEVRGNQHEPKRARRKKKDNPKLQWKIWETENSKWIDDHNDESDDPEDEDGFFPETTDPCPWILLPLFRFQKEWLAWALMQEDSVTRGGVLADEMGMGKTIQAISLVLTARWLRNMSPNVVHADMASSAQLSMTGATLVICPVVAVMQWAGEIDQHVEMGKARVLVYHGPKRGQGRYDFRNYDFVLTTYSTIEGDYRRNIMPAKVKCMYCGGKFMDKKKLNLHLWYHCGPRAQKTEAQAKQQKKRKDMPKMKGVDYDHDDKDEDMKGKGKKKQKAEDEVDATRKESPLHMMKWERIILDEAHFIKDRRSNTARAIFALDSVYKWALSGTPLQNRVGELYSLVRFLQVSPYACYFCRDCDCKIFDYTLNGNCINCPHANVRHFCWWNRHINNPVRKGHTLESKRAMVLLRKRVLKSIVLRRTKQGRAADFALPSRIVCLRRDSLDRNEQEFYEALYTQSVTQFNGYVGTGTLMNNYAHIFDLLTRLRQAVDHPYLVVYSKTAGVPVGAAEANAMADCGICHYPVENAVVTSCDHTFCKVCLMDFSATFNPSSLGNVPCPSCSKPLTVDLTTSVCREKYAAAAIKGYKRSGILSRIETSDFKTSTKIDALKEEIRNMVEYDSSAKGIVFSQFTSFLDLIRFSLEKCGVKCVQLVGSMTLSDRGKAIKTFTEDGDCKIFLLSLKAGGVALNLTVASHVFLMDPWWNPAVERQAQDRIHRIGQYKPIRTVRFVIEDTIEERILQLQAKKELVFEGTVGDSKDAMAKLTEADLRVCDFSSRPRRLGIRLVPAVYVFGDSLADVGNNNHLYLSYLKADYPHNGIDFPGGKATGRFSNGKNSADFLAEKLGVSSSPPYLSMGADSNQTRALLAGINFASAGGGILDSTNKNLCLTLNQQIQYYSSVHSNLMQQLGSTQAGGHLSKSIFAFMIGSNDILNSKLSGDQLVHSMITSLRTQLKNLYNLGARKFAFVGTGFIGCCPIQRDKMTGNCNAERNTISFQFDTALAALLQEMKSELSGMNYSFFNSTLSLSEYMQNPATYGFIEVKAACCGLGSLSAKIGCLPVSSLCPNRSNHIFWDFYHPSERTSELLAATFLEGSPPHVYPINLKQLSTL